MGPDGFFLPAIAGLGALTSFDDLRSGRIRNRWILFSLMYGLVIHGILFAVLLAQGTPAWPHLREVLTNAACALAAGYALWKIRIWSAADGKLFFAFAFLVPLSSYSHGYLRVFPSFALLVNIFSLALVVFLSEAVLHVTVHLAATLRRPRECRRAVAEYFRGLRDHARHRIADAAFYVLFFLAFRILQMELGNLLAKTMAPQALVFLLLFLVHRPVRRLYANPRGRRMLLAFLLAGVAAVAFVYRTPSLLVHAVTMTGGFVLLLMVIRRMGEFYVRRTQLQWVAVSRLRGSELPTEDAGRRISQWIGRVDADGLAPHQVQTLKERLPPDSAIEVYRTVAFAHVVFGGVLLTLLLRQSAIHFLYQRL